MGIQEEAMRLHPSLSATLIAVSAATLPEARAAAGEFPTKPITLVIPFGPGGASDLTARTFIHLSQEILGQPMIIQTKPGGGGAIGSEFVAQAKPDGYTLLVGHTNCNSILPAIAGQSKGPDDLAAVARINTSGTIFVAQPNAPFNNLKEMVAWAKAHPGELSVSTAGTWSQVDFTWRTIERDYSLKMRNVSYTGGAEALVALLGGHVGASLLSAPQTLPHVAAGKLKVLAYLGSKRHRELSNVPTAEEQGFRNTLTVFKGIMAPKGTPKPIIDKLANAFKKMLENPQVVKAIEKQGEPVEYLGPDEFAKYWRAEYDAYRDIGKMFKK
jgi:tripartite-type tricarboxylate transporter receptor subunit TctC